MTKTETRPAEEFTIFDNSNITFSTQLVSKK